MIKKILACVVALIMCMSLVNVAAFASDEVELPECTVNDITGDDLQITDDFKLDFGKNFVAVDTSEDLFNNPKADWLVDFEITFSEDTTAILAGQYDNVWTGEDWVIGDERYAQYGLNEYGYGFIGGKSYKIMEEFFGPLWESNGSNVNFIYSDVINMVKDFYCGVKLTGNKDVDITLKLCLYEAVKGDLVNNHFEYITNGVSHTVYEENFSYKSISTALESTTDDMKKVEFINEQADEFNAETVADAVKALNEEAKAAIKPSTIEKLAEAVDTESSIASVEVTTIAGTNASLVITIEEADDADHAALEGGIVYDIDATVGGVEKPVLDAPVLIKIPVADPDSIIEVRHCHDGVIESIPFEKGTGYIAFTAVKFSQYALITDAEPEDGSAVLEFVPNDVDPDDGILTYDLVLRGTDVDVVRGFTAGEFTVAISDAQARWAIAPVNSETNIKLESTNGNERKYLVNLKSFDKVNSWTANVTDENLKLGTLTVEGYGVEGYIAFGDEILMSKHDYTVDAENLTAAIETAPGSSAYFNIPVPTRKVIINVIANHKVVNQNWNYQDMTVTISGVDLLEDKIFNLGAESTDVDFANDIYTVEADLVLNRDYTVKVEGAGYRTAEYNFTMTTDKTINFWNNVKDYDDAMEVYSNGTKDGYAASNFVAGDIVEDNIINIYDLSAVVSYFDEKVTDFTVKNSLAQYDLNRDGNINSRDISILLESWNK